MTTGERIKKLRKEKSISQTELANILNITQQNIYKYENDIIVNIPVDKIEIIADFFEVSPNYLMGWNEKSELTEFEKKLITSYYSKSKDIQQIINKILEIES